MFVASGNNVSVGKGGRRLPGGQFTVHLRQWLDLFQLALCTQLCQLDRQSVEHRQRRHACRLRPLLVFLRNQQRILPQRQSVRSGTDNGRRVGCLVQPWTERHRGSGQRTLSRKDTAVRVCPRSSHWSSEYHYSLDERRSLGGFPSRKFSLFHFN